MKRLRVLPSHPVVSRMFGAAFCFYPVVLLAHPGHYHPEETDEFDLLRSTVAHSHGMLDLVLFGLMLAALGFALFGEKTAYRLGALTVGLGSISLLSLF